jgi:hypothetical protein
MFTKKKTVTVTVKLFSGLATCSNLTGHDPGKGTQVQVKEGTRLKKLVSQVGLRNISSNVYLIDGERASLWSRLRDGNEVMCLKPSSGG